MSRVRVVIRDVDLGMHFVPGFPTKGDGLVIMCCDQSIQGAIQHVQYTVSTDESINDKRETTLYVACETQRQLHEFLAHRRTHGVKPV